MKKPVFLLMTDTHLNSNNLGLNESVYQQAIDLALKLDLSEVWHLGDVFDSRKGQPLCVLNLFGRILDMFENNGIDLHVIPGNHDKIDYESDESYLDIYARRTCLTVHDQPETLLIGNSRLLLIPYYRESTIYNDKLNQLFPIKIETGISNLMFTHCAFTGVKNNDGTLVTNGVTGEDMEDIQIFVGHYHNRTKVGKNITYIGSAMQHNFGEDEEKGFCVVDEEGKYYFHQANFPKFINQYVDVSNMNLIEIKALADKSKDSEDNIRFTLTGTKEQVNAIDDNLIKELGIDVKRKANELQTGIEEAENGQFTSFSEQELIKEFGLFCEENKIKDIETGLTILKQAL